MAQSPQPGAPNQHGNSHGVVGGVVGDDALYVTMMGPNYNKAQTVTPSATINTNGATVTYVPDTGYSAIVNVNPFGLFITATGVSAETLTVTVTVHYSDGSSSSGVTLATTTGAATTLGTGVFSALIKDGVVITSITAVAQSSKASSTAVATLTLWGQNGV